MAVSGHRSPVLAPKDLPDHRTLWQHCAHRSALRPCDPLHLSTQRPPCSPSAATQRPPCSPSAAFSIAAAPCGLSAAFMAVAMAPRRLDGPPGGALAC
jgi:hypothetical protein